MQDIVDQIASENLEGVRFKDEFISASCPFHGVDRHPSFWIARATGHWGCFACSERGSDLADLLSRLGVSKRGVEYRLNEAKKDRTKTRAKEEIRRKKKARKSFEGTHTLPESVLGVYDYCPELLLDQGFDEEILQSHDIGFDFERKRITFPIRDIKGNLIGISGRTVNHEHPKYKVYQGPHDIILKDGSKKRVKGELGEWFPGYSSTDIRDHLYRGNLVWEDLYSEPVEEPYLVVVEGYKAALWLVQMGYEYTVALMGSRMSSNQERIIRRMGVPTFILLDNNDAGIEGTDSICRRLGTATFPVYRCEYPQGCDESFQPDDLREVQVEEIFSNSQRVARGRRRGALHGANSRRTQVQSTSN